MLARVAENVYWLARYLERAENSARIVSVNTNLLLDLPRGYAPGWLPLVDISGSRALFDARQGEGDERSVVNFLVADPENPGSISESLRMARENARTLREVLPNDAWEMLNELFGSFTVDVGSALAKRTRFAFLRQLIASVQTFAGKLDGTMNRNEAYTFYAVGCSLERADMTSRIVDVRSAHLLPEKTRELRPFETVQWMSVLKSLSGYQMYRLRTRTRVTRPAVLEFLLRDDQFPRAYLASLQRVATAVATLPRAVPVQAGLERALAHILAVDFTALDQAGLHELIDQLQLHVIALHDGISAAWFPQPAGTDHPELRAVASG